MKRLLAATLLVGLMTPAAPAGAAENCVTHNEYDNMVRLLTVGQVANRFDTNGVYLGAGPERWRRGYDACWTNERRVVVWFSFTTGLSDDWAMQDY
jgi:hypothetical protein